MNAHLSPTIGYFSMLYGCIHSASTLCRQAPLALLSSLYAQPAHADDSVHVTLAFEDESYSYDDQNLGGGTGATEDPEELAELAFVDNVGFDAISEITLADLHFSAHPVDRHVSELCTVVLRTEGGRYYKFGNVVEQEYGVSFDCGLVK